MIKIADKIMLSIKVDGVRIYFYFLILNIAG